MARDLMKHVYIDGEIELLKRRMEETPVLALELFRACFNESGKQVYEIPPFILEFLSRRFADFLSEETLTNSLDQAFGGKVARQRNALRTADQMWSVIFDLIGFIEEGKALSGSDRSQSTPFEYGVSKTAEQYGLSEDRVHQLYVQSQNKKDNSKF